VFLCVSVCRDFLNGLRACVRLPPHLASPDLQPAHLQLDASASADEVKRVLRVVTLRWHPDKFAHTFGPHLHPDHAERILERVNAITSGVNWLRRTCS
jgi:hypothetical protein